MLLTVHVSGKLTSADYEHFVPEFERLVEQHGQLRVLFDMTDFHGWDAGALWADTKFAIHHFADIERIAMVGKTKMATRHGHFLQAVHESKNPILRSRQSHRGAGVVGRSVANLTGDSR